MSQVLWYSALASENVVISFHYPCWCRARSHSIRAKVLIMYCRQAYTFHSSLTIINYSIKFHWIWIKTYFHLRNWCEIPSSKWRSFCYGLNELIELCTSVWYTTPMHFSIYMLGRWQCDENNFTHLKNGHSRPLYHLAIANPVNYTHSIKIRYLISKNVFSFCHDQTFCNFCSQPIGYYDMHYAKCHFAFEGLLKTI